MTNDRRGILSLLASGRITAREAERLIAAVQLGSEGLWIGLAVFFACALQMLSHPGVADPGGPLRELVAGIAKALQGVISVAGSGKGGAI